jgi:hypothetical protein
MIRDTTQRLASFEKEMQDCGVFFHDLGNSQVLITKLPDRLTERTLKTCLSEIKNPKNISYDDRLAGQIFNGNQIEFPIGLKSDHIRELGDTLTALGNTFVHRFWIKHGIDSKPRKRQNTRNIQLHDISTNINDIWIVEQKENDFNPTHDHNTISPAGLSGVFYVRVPWEVTKPPGPGSNGLLKLVFGGNANSNIYNFTGSETRTINIEDGLLVLFPSKMMHMVDPYYKKYKNSRICVPFNLNVWYPHLNKG